MTIFFMFYCSQLRAAELEQLKKSNLFNNEMFVDWVMEDSKNYPELLEHFLLLDNLRYQLIDVIENYRL